MITNTDSDSDFRLAFQRLSQDEKLGAYNDALKRMPKNDEIRIRRQAARLSGSKQRSGKKRAGIPGIGADGALEIIGALAAFMALAEETETK